MQRPASSPSITSEPKKEEIMGNWDIEEAVFRKKGDGRA